MSAFTSTNCNISDVNSVSIDNFTKFSSEQHRSIDLISNQYNIPFFTTYRESNIFSGIKWMNVKESTIDGFKIHYIYQNTPHKKDDNNDRYNLIFMPHFWNNDKSDFEFLSKGILQVYYLNDKGKIIQINMDEMNKYNESKIYSIHKTGVLDELVISDEQEIPETVKNLIFKKQRLYVTFKWFNENGNYWKNGDAYFYGIYDFADTNWTFDTNTGEPNYNNYVDVKNNPKISDDEICEEMQKFVKKMQVDKNALLGIKAKKPTSPKGNSTNGPSAGGGGPNTVFNFTGSSSASGGGQPSTGTNPKSKTSNLITVNVKYAFAPAGNPAINIEPALCKDSIFTENINTTNIDVGKQINEMAVKIKEVYKKFITQTNLMFQNVDDYMFYLKENNSNNYKWLPTENFVIIAGHIYYRTYGSFEPAEELYSKFSEITDGSTIFITHINGDNCLPKQSLSNFALQYVDNQTLYTRLVLFNKRFESIRKIRGDGNCYYASVMFGLFENIIADKITGKDRMEKLKNNIKNALNANNDVVITLLKYPQGGYINEPNNNPRPKHYDDFNQYINTLLTKDWKTAEDFETNYMQNNWLYETLVTIGKILVSLWFIENHSKDANGLKIGFAQYANATETWSNENYDNYNTNKSNIDDLAMSFCINYIMRWGENAEGTFVELNALGEKLHCDIKRVFNQRTAANVDMPDSIYTYSGADKNGSVTILLSPGHYDLLYERPKILPAGGGGSSAVISTDKDEIIKDVNNAISKSDYDTIIAVAKSIQSNPIKSDIDKHMNTLVGVDKLVNNICAYIYFNCTRTDFNIDEINIHNKINKFIFEKTKSGSGVDSNLLRKTLNNYETKFAGQLCNGLTIAKIGNDGIVANSYKNSDVYKILHNPSITIPTTGVSPNITIDVIAQSCDKFLNANSSAIYTANLTKFYNKKINWKNAILDARYEIIECDNRNTDMQLCFQGWLFENDEDNKISYPLIGIYGDADEIQIQNNSVGKNDLTISMFNTKFVQQNYKTETGAIGDANSAIVKITNICDFFAVCVDLNNLEQPRILLVYVHMVDPNYAMINIDEVFDKVKNVFNNYFTTALTYESNISRQNLPPPPPVAGTVTSNKKKASNAATGNAPDLYPPQPPVAGTAKPALTSTSTSTLIPTSITAPIFIQVKFKGIEIQGNVEIINSAAAGSPISLSNCITKLTSNPINASDEKTFVIELGPAEIEAMDALVADILNTP